MFVFFRGRISELQFKRPTESDTATYTCEAVNNLGKFGTSGNLTVIKGKGLKQLFKPIAIIITLTRQTFAKLLFPYLNQKLRQQICFAIPQ